MSFKVPEKCRLISGPLASTILHGNNGAFVITKGRFKYKCMASDGMGWEHVSVSMFIERTPDWEEMCMIKDIFWDEEDSVIQIHPPKSEYVNCHHYCLHLWRPVGIELMRPTSDMVGPKGITI